MKITYNITITNMHLNFRIKQLYLYKDYQVIIKNLIIYLYKVIKIKYYNILV